MYLYISILPVAGYKILGVRWVARYLVCGVGVKGNNGYIYFS